MKFQSTNGGFEVSSFSEAILTGLCPDGGLLMPMNLPLLSDVQLDDWKGLSYPSLLTKFMQYIVDQDDPIYEYLKDIEKETFKDFVKNSTQIKKLQNLSVLELFHGPTLAFKDYAMFPLAFLLDKAIKIKANKNNNGKIIKQNLVIATTGDTGSSALEASRNFTDTLNVFVLFPKERITEIQRLQMTTSNTDNGYPIECSGTCDDIEVHIRALNEDRDFSDKYDISCLNSINCGRILCQIAIHLFAYLQISEDKEKAVNIAIPCGGLGNLISACLAKSMNLNIKIILCNNKNNLGDIMIKTGVIQKQSESYHTLSSAMDATLPYNISRLLWIFSDQDTTFTKSTMEKIVNGEKVILPTAMYQKIRSVIVDSYSVSDEDTLKTMAKCYEEENYYICPHTATSVSYFYNKKSINEGNIGYATASINKFTDAAFKAGLLHHFKSNSLLLALQSKTESYAIMNLMEDPLLFLKTFIASHNK